MPYFKFDDKKIQKAFNRIASVDNKSNKIDSEREVEAIGNLLSGCEGKISKHDIALLLSQTLEFDNKDIKKAFKEISGQNGNREIDTDEEYELAKKFLEENQDNMSDNDVSLFKNLMDVFKSNTQKIVINANVQNGGTLQIAIGENLTNSINSNAEDSLKTELSQDEAPDEHNNPPDNNLDEDVVLTDETDETEVVVSDVKETSASDVPIEKPMTPVEDAVREYKVKGGDYWYKIIQENYNLSSHNEIMQVVRKFKQEYFEANKFELTKQGYNTPNDGFFPKAGYVFNLPKIITINEKTVELKQ